MNPRPAGTRRRSPAARVLPDLLLVLLVGAAPVLQFPRSGWLAALAAIWTGIAAALALAAVVRRESAADGQAGRDLRLLLLAVGSVSAAAAVATASVGSGALAAVPLLRLGLCGVAVVIAAACVAGWWPAPALAACAVSLEVVQALAAREPVATDAAWGVLGSAVSLALLAFVSTRAFREWHRDRAKLLGVIDKHQRLRSEAEKLRARGFDRRAAKVRNLTPEGRQVSTLSAVVEIDRSLDRVLKLAALAVGARSVVLFLSTGDGAFLALRHAVEGEETKIDRETTPVVGEGVVGNVAKTRRPALFTNLEAGSLRPPLYISETPVPSLAAVPVNEPGGFCGVLLADAAVPGAFGHEQERLLEGFAGEVGKLLEEASAAAGRRRLGDKFETLAAISRDLSSTMKIDEILERMLDHTCEIVPYDRYALFIADPAARTLTLRSQRDFLPEASDECRISFDHGLAGLVATERKQKHFHDLANRGTAIEIIPGSRGQERIRSFLGLPLLNAAELVGVWVLVSETPGSFDDEHIDILTVVAAQAATLISNAVLHQTVERMAVTDGLTGLYNHRWFQERLAYELQRGDRHEQPLSLLLLDIDHFKKINDTHGHPFGDLVLRTLAAELAGLARNVDFVARYGGEEFAFILVNADRRGCRKSAERVLKAVRKLRIPHEGGDFAFTLSIGTATYPDDAATREDLVRCADKALYAAKEGGRDRAVACDERGGAPASCAPETGRWKRVATR
jgi:diguanylate cyclase (GGDEF)-like protein